MAKQLPAIDLTDAQYARVAKVIPGDTAAEKAENYTTWVKQQLRERIVKSDIDAAREEANALVRDAEQAAIDNVDNL